MSEMPRVMRILAGVAGLMAAAYGLLAALAFFYQRALIYPAPVNPIEPRVRGAKLERIAGPNGTSVYVLHAPARDGAPTIVHFHGNAEDLAGQGMLMTSLVDAGVGVYAVEYPGYGLARGAMLTEDSVYAAADAALAYLHTVLGIPREKTVLQGQSLGTGIAAEMARRGHGARLVLISPYTSMVDMAAIAAPFLPTRWLVRDRYDTDRKAPDIVLPALVIHGSDDEVIPVAMGRRIARLLPRSELVVVPGGHHADLFEQEGEPLFARIAAFACSESRQP
jgi:pimeloyl-ACP methyl ester carboxylesterase